MSQFPSPKEHAFAMDPNNFPNRETPQITGQVSDHNHANIDLNSSPANPNCSLSTSNLLLGAQVITPSLWDHHNFDDLDSLSCTQILGLANLDDATPIGSLPKQDFQSGFNGNVEQVVTPSSTANSVMENEKIATPQHKSKKRNIGIDSNKSHGGKRQNKFYWPKIDDKKPTPKPKTPKQVTPKPKRNYVRKNGSVAASTCKQSLNFGDDKVSSLNLDLGFEFNPGLKVAENTPTTPKPKRKYVRKKGVTAIATESSNEVVEEIPKDLDLKLNPLGFNHSEVKHVEMQVPDSDNRNISSNEADVVKMMGDVKEAVNLKVQEVDINQEKKIMRKSTRVYQRRRTSKCLSECQKLGLNLQGSCKRRRMPRRKMSIMALKKLEGLDGFVILQELLDRIAIVRGKKGMLLPTKAEFSPESHECIFTLLSKLKTSGKKRRSAKRSGKANYIAKEKGTGDETSCVSVESQSSNNENGGEVGLKGLDKPSGEVVLKGLDEPAGSLLEALMNVTENEAELHMEQNECNTVGQTCQTSLEDTLLSSSNVKDPDGFINQGSKTKATKQKKGRPSKSKVAKRLDYSGGLSNWNVEALEQIMDPLIKHFESMDLYDNPKTLERWSVLNDAEENRGDGVEKTYEEKVKWEEERRALLKKIGRFLYVMTRSQGPRDFVKWKGSVLDSVVGVFLTQNVSDVLSSNAYMELGSRYPLKSSSNQNEAGSRDSEISSSQGSSCRATTTRVFIEHPEEDEAAKDEEWRSKEFDDAMKEMFTSYSDLKTGKGKGKQAEDIENIDWEAIRVMFAGEGQKERSPDTQDSVDWEAVRNAPVDDIAKAIHGRGQHRIIAAKIKKTLNRLVEQHGTLDLEWLREAPPEVAKAYILSFYGLGLKSVECLRLLTLHHHAFPVDVNIARIVIRLGWVPLEPLPMGLHFHLLEKYPLENKIQNYLWPRLCHLDQKTLYKLHYQMITFGKVFCGKKNPNCGACPFKGECKYYASKVSSKLALPGAQERRVTKSKRAIKRMIRNPFDIKRSSSPHLALPAPKINSTLEISRPYNCMTIDKCQIIEAPASPEPQLEDPAYPEPRVEEPASPEPRVEELASPEPRVQKVASPEAQVEVPASPKPQVNVLATLEAQVEVPASPKPQVEEPYVPDIEDLFSNKVNNDSDADEEIIEINLISEEFKQTLRNYLEENNVPVHNDDLSRALVCLPPDEASIPLPKHMFVARLRTEHQVYELPDFHPLLANLQLDRRDEKDPLPYLLAMWTPDQIANNGGSSKVCDVGTDKSSYPHDNTQDQDSSLTVPATLLIPSRTAMKGSFALNGTYFQVNEVFADDETSQQPILVPRGWLWNLPRRTLYCGSSTTSIFRDLTWREIQRCCCEGFICTRGFNRRTRAPKPLSTRLHSRPKGKLQQSEEEE